jgi:predicted Zn-dependent protease
MVAQALKREPVVIKSFGTIPLVFIASFTGESALLPVAYLNRQREAELQADRLAVQDVSRAGLDPAALLRYIQRVQPVDRPFSPFPPREARIAALEEAIRELPPVTPTDSGKFFVVQELARSDVREPDPVTRPRPTLKRQ